MKIVKIKTLFIALSVSLASFGQDADSLVNYSDAKLVFPDSSGWNMVHENQEVSFQVNTTELDSAFFSIHGADDLGITFDSAGNFYWKPSYDLIDRVTRVKDFTVIFEASWPHMANNPRIREEVTFVVRHVNRPPVVEELPVFYVKQSTNNTYQFPSEFVYDLDGDPLVFKSILSEMPEGSSLSSQGQFTWSPSRTQFLSMRREPLEVKFIVEDQPEKKETIGVIRIAPTQQDLPPEIHAGRRLFFHMLNVFV